MQPRTSRNINQNIGIIYGPKTIEEHMNELVKHLDPSSMLYKYDRFKIWKHELYRLGSDSKFNIEKFYRKYMETEKEMTLDEAREFVRKKFKSFPDVIIERGIEDIPYECSIELWFYAACIDKFKFDPDPNPEPIFIFGSRIVTEWRILKKMHDKKFQTIEDSKWIIDIVNDIWK